MISLDLAVNAVVAGLLLGGFYAAVTIGVTISFGMLDIVNIAHPAFIMLGSLQPMRSTRACARRDFLARRTGHASINFRAQYQVIRHQTSCRHDVLGGLKTGIDREKFDFPADFRSVREGFGTCSGHLKTLTGGLGGAG